ncbi:hypothetical protein HK100_010512, partial [Physocladia obscura]
MSLYTGTFVVFTNASGGYASGCQYEGTALKTIEADENVNCGPQCQDSIVTLGCSYFSFIAAGNLGTCYLYGNGTQTLGPYAASSNDVCGYFGSSATPSATTASSPSATTASSPSATIASSPSATTASSLSGILASTSTGRVIASETFTRTDTSSINTSNSSSGSNIGAIVGGIIGAFVVAGFAALGFVWWTRRQNRANQNKKYAGKPSINPPQDQNNKHYQLQLSNAFAVVSTNNSTPAPNGVNSDPRNPSSQDHYPNRQLNFGAVAGTVPNAKFNLFNSINDRNHGDSFTTT